MSKDTKPIPKPIRGTTKLTNISDIDAIVASLGKTGWPSVPANRISEVPDSPGVYVFTLPAGDRHCKGRLTLFGRTFRPQGEKRQLHFSFEYNARTLEGTSHLVLYIGKAANLKSRLKGHLLKHDDSTTSQMLVGLASQAVHHGEERNVDASLKHLLEKATIYYYEHGHPDESTHDPRSAENVGQSFTADRDLLEIKLIAKYAPPYNIKAER